MVGSKRRAWLADSTRRARHAHLGPVGRGREPGTTMPSLLRAGGRSRAEDRIAQFFEYATVIECPNYGAQSPGPGGDRAIRTANGGGESRVSRPFGQTGRQFRDLLVIAVRQIEWRNHAVWERVQVPWSLRTGRQRPASRVPVERRDAERGCRRFRGDRGESKSGEPGGVA